MSANTTQNAATHPRVVISNGFHRYHLSAAAAELDRMGHLAGFVTGAYPSKTLKALARALPFLRHRRLSRLMDREEHITPQAVTSLTGVELLYTLFTELRHVRVARTLAEEGRSAMFRLYGRSAAAAVRKASGAGANLYHYRSGFGGASAEEARRLGMALLCDHTIVHPCVLGYMLRNQGRFPPAGTVMTPGRDIEAFWSPVLEDIARADAVLVNSDFVKETFVQQGYPAEKVHVVYQGVDDKFLNAVPPRPALDSAGPLRLMFAGTFEVRKGADELVAGLRQLDDLDWRLTMAGNLNPEVAARHREFLADPRVTHLGGLPRADLAQALSRAEVFLFPSLAEGSARVVFEAMACGCPVIVTPNAGSIARDGEHGWVVPAGDPQALALAVRLALERRADLDAMGRRNAHTVREGYLQKDFGRRLVAVYAGLLDELRNAAAVQR